METLTQFKWVELAYSIAPGQASCTNDHYGFKTCAGKVLIFLPRAGFCDLQRKGVVELEISGVSAKALPQGA